jgi:hypothetical protein
VQYLYALERTGEADPAFQLYPPLPAGGGDAGGEPAADRLAAPPARPPGYGFDAYRQSLAACVLTEEEDRGDVAVWRREFTADQKTAYCTKWVEPWASLHAREMRDQEIPRLSISDNRCWQHMRARHEEQIQYCLDKDNGRTPANELDLTPAQCRQVKDLDDTYLYCGELRFLPEYTEAREPTLWGCYDRFPWLRAREPFGPDCSHIAQRILAAYLYVKLRAEAGAAAADAVTWDGLQSIMTLDEYVRLLRAVAVGPREEDVRRLEALVRELARVQVDVPVFVRPAGAAQTTATRTARRPEGAAEPDFVPLPWYAHAEWVRPEARAFAPLLDGFLLACGPEDQEPGAPATACAPDGGRLKSQMAIRVDDRTPGPLWATAQALAVLLAQEEHTGLFELRQAVADVERRCFAAGTYDPGCLRGLAAEAGDGPRRDRALALLASAPAPDTALLAGVLLDVAHAADASSDLRATAALVLQRTRLECCPRGAAGCDPEPCEQLRFGEVPPKGRPTAPAASPPDRLPRAWRPALRPAPPSSRARRPASGGCRRRSSRGSCASTRAASATATRPRCARTRNSPVVSR